VPHDLVKHPLIAPNPSPILGPTLWLVEHLQRLQQYSVV